MTTATRDKDILSRLRFCTRQNLSTIKVRFADKRKGEELSTIPYLSGFLIAWKSSSDCLKKYWYRHQHQNINQKELSFSKLNRFEKCFEFFFLKLQDVFHVQREKHKFSSTNKWKYIKFIKLKYGKHCNITQTYIFQILILNFNKYLIQILIIENYYNNEL